MFNICFEDKIITFTESYPADYDSGMSVCLNGKADITKVLQILENCKRVYILSTDAEASYREFCSSFIELEAAGGVVENAHGELLMIYRLGRWDLPKGHRENGEELHDCALREVEEECGIKGVVLGRFICSTQHIYPLNGKWMLKTSHWWHMLFDGSRRCTPQLEEGIDDARWMVRKELGEVLKTSFCTIREVIEKFQKQIGDEEISTINTCGSDFGGGIVQQKS